MDRLEGSRGPKGDGLGLVGNPSRQPGRQSQQSGKLVLQGQFRPLFGKGDLGRLLDPVEAKSHPAPDRLPGVFHGLGQLCGSHGLQLGHHLGRIGGWRDAQGQGVHVHPQVDPVGLLALNQEGGLSEGEVVGQGRGGSQKDPPRQANGRLPQACAHGRNLIRLVPQPPHGRTRSTGEDCRPAFLTGGRNHGTGFLRGRGNCVIGLAS